MKKTRAQTIAEIEANFPGKFDFSAWDEDHVGAATSVKTGCSACGHIFYPTPSDLKRGKHRCKPCSDVEKHERAVNDFITKSTKIHNGRYDYSKVDYVNSQTKVCITCIEHGVEFYQIPAKHKSGATSCDKCKKENASSNNRLSFSTLITNLEAVNPDLYDYSEVSESDYINQNSKIKIFCNKHKVFFEQSIGKRLQNKTACEQCKSEKVFNDADDFITDCAKQHDNFYDYSDVVYSGSDKMLHNIHCPTHGYFDQRADSHKGGNRCSACSNAGISALENELFDFIKSLNSTAYQSDRKLLDGKELDIVIPDKNVAIEFCGIYWHTEKMGKYKNYHREKFDNCKKLGIQLLTIFEDEWNNSKDQIKNKLRILVGTDDRRVVYARKTEVREVSKKDKAEFFTINHIQGDGLSSINYGLFHDDELVACVGFMRMSNGNFQLNRYATSVKVIGGINKLLKHFKKTNSWNKIISFADLRWSDGKLYDDTDWVLDKRLLPTYSYYYKGVRYDRRKFRKCYLVEWFGDNYDPSLSESKNCQNNGASKIWDCGMYRFIMENSE